MEKYITTLLSQIRCERIHSEIEREIRGHLEEQIEANEEAGMDKQRAIQEAVKDMGNPVEAGIELDRIHRPQPARDMIIFMACVTLLGMLLHVKLGSYMEEVNKISALQYILQSCASYLIGFLLMIVVYRIDYSRIAKASRESFGALLVFGGYQIYLQNEAFIGSGYVMFLIVPVYAAMLYWYIGSGYREIIKALLGIIVAGAVTLRVAGVGLTAELLLMMFAVLSIAVWKGWFEVNRKKFLTVFWSIILIGPVAFLWAAVRFSLIKEYQIARLQALFKTQAT